MSDCIAIDLKNCYSFKWFNNAQIIQHDKQGHLSKESFDKYWPVIVKIWNNRPGCMLYGCCKRTFAFHFYMEDDVKRRLSPGLARAVLIEGVKRGLLTKGLDQNGFKTFCLLSKVN